MFPLLEFPEISGESGSEASSDATDENANQVCAPLLSLFILKISICDLYMIFNCKKVVLGLVLKWVLVLCKISMVTQIGYCFIMSAQLLS